MSNEIEVSVQEIVIITKKWFYYFLSQWKIILILCVLFVATGIFYAWRQKTTYLAELTFTAESEGSGNMGAYAGIASQLGLNFGSGGSGSAFKDENLMYLMKSRVLIEKTLFTRVTTDTGSVLLINYYLKMKSLENEKEDKEKDIVFFNSNGDSDSRERDSVILRISSEIANAITIERIDKKSDIISVKMESRDEFFSKVFVEELVNTVIQYYTSYKVKKIRQNVEILQHQTDSIRNLINTNIVDIAVTSDLNVNPTRQITQTGIQRRQVDAQVNGAMYTELVKNLELSKLTLRKETPLIQIIDTPVFPLNKKKMSMVKGAILFGLGGLIVTLMLLTLIRLYSTTRNL